ncbi:probable aryl-alcohol dehydrogenase protein [Sphingobium indicum BiD32]|uniref:Probable aryl-alcohol dehydrogenase protein n=1 Tax=Sphingobium indicum BiD32 TaxID=1301087 RepID=N1MGY2_9SPHN|nr:NAD(P)-dependent alcohol dehydrogenase [Sphingobium indicum]CCW16490.1 probable aryl-alcohol dehydrogenase protein [Sphingobium indicum BiD32]
MEIAAAVVRNAGGRFTLETVQIDQPRDDEILVRIVGVGLCHTDLVARDQSVPYPLPAVLGHEGSGVVERTGPLVTKVAPGDHVVLTFASCGQCAPCRDGRPAYCQEFAARNFAGIRAAGGSTLRGHDGGNLCGCFFGQSSFADYAMASERNVVKIAQDVPLDIMGPLGCSIQTGAGAVLNALRPVPGSSIAVFGAGSVGMAAILAARVAGCAHIIAVDLNQTRLDLALDLGATHAICAADTDPVAAIRALTNDEGVAYAIECTGVPKVVRQAVECVRVTGTCGLVGTAPMGAETSLDINSLVLGRTLRGIVEGDSLPDLFIPQLIALWRQGHFPFDRLITFYRLDDINKAVEDVGQGHVLKPVLLP